MYYGVLNTGHGSFTISFNGAGTRSSDSEGSARGVDVVGDMNED